MVPKAGGTITDADGASLVATPLARAVRSNATLSWPPDLILKICGAIETPSRSDRRRMALRARTWACGSSTASTRG